MYALIWRAEEFLDILNLLGILNVLVKENNERFNVGIAFEFHTNRPVIGVIHISLGQISSLDSTRDY